MHAGGIHHVELILLFLLFLVGALTTLSRRFQTPYPIVLVIGGLLLSFVPNLPRISLNPDMVFLVLLPPLLFAAAFNTSWHDFRFHLVSVTMLAFGLVGFTVAGVALTSHYLLPGFDWRLGLVLGAVVCSTDAIAATAIASRIGLPRTIVDVLEGESLVNDASSLLALEFAATLVVSGRSPSLGEGVIKLLVLVGGGLLIGWVSAWLLQRLQRQLADPPIEITLSLMAPYLSYLTAEALHASGPLATVVCGLYLGQKRAEVFTTEARLENSAVWNTLDFVLNGIVFIMIGLQLPFILDGIREMRHTVLLRDAAILCVTVIALRLLWMFPAAQIAYEIRTRVFGQRYPRPGTRTCFVMGWTGMRGVMALAAAFSLPQEIESGAPFPERNVIIFLTFSVILVTLVLQGLTLPTIIRRLGLCEADPLAKVEREARRQLLRAALEYLESVEDREGAVDREVWEDAVRHYRERYALFDDAQSDKNSGANIGAPQRPNSWETMHDLNTRIRAAERQALARMRAEDRMSDYVLRKLERELDLADLRFLS